MSFSHTVHATHHLLMHALNAAFSLCIKDKFVVFLNASRAIKQSQDTMPIWPGCIAQGCRRVQEHGSMPMEDHGPSADSQSLTHGPLSTVCVTAGQKQVEVVLLGQPSGRETSVPPFWCLAEQCRIENYGRSPLQGSKLRWCTRPARRTRPWRDRLSRDVSSFAYFCSWT